MTVKLLVLHWIWQVAAPGAERARLDQDAAAV
jgi:hypothetical protein